MTEALEAFRTANKPADGTDSGQRPDRSALESALAASLAKSLRIEEAKVKTALEEIEAAEQSERAEALKTRLDAAVKDGTLTQAEADSTSAQADDDPYLTDVNVRPGESLGGPDGGPIVTRPQATREEAEAQPDDEQTERVWTDRD